MGKNVCYTCDKCGREIDRCKYYSDGFYLKIEGTIFGECEPEQEKFKAFLNKINNNYYCNDCRPKILVGLLTVLKEKPSAQLHKR